MRLDFCKCEVRNESYNRINPDSAAYRDLVNTQQFFCEVVHGV
jgi:hypothetical protein